MAEREFIISIVFLIALYQHLNLLAGSLNALVESEITVMCFLSSSVLVCVSDFFFVVKPDKVEFLAFWPFWLLMNFCYPQKQQNKPTLLIFKRNFNTSRKEVISAIT